jgi:hypothetical protein
MRAFFHLTYRETGGMRSTKTFFKNITIYSSLSDIIRRIKRLDSEGSFDIDDKSG